MRVRSAISVLGMGNGFGGFASFGPRPAHAALAAGERTLSSSSSSASSFSSVSLCVPAQLTEAVYTALAEADCIPRRWHPEGREGISIQARKLLWEFREVALVPGGSTGAACEAAVAALGGVARQVREVPNGPKVSALDFAGLLSCP